MNNFSKANLHQLIHTADKCSISLYMPTHRSTAEKEQDQIGVRYVPGAGDEGSQATKVQIVYKPGASGSESD
jgi:hypothetical protein